MRTQILFFIMIFFLVNPIKSQNQHNLSLLIKDSVKTFRISCNNDKYSKAFLNKAMNRKMRFKMNICNHNNGKVVLYLLNKEAGRLPEAYLVQDTSLIIKDTSFYYMGLFVQDTNRYKPIVIPEFRRPDTSGLKNDTLKLFYSSDRMLRCLNNKLGGYFGFTYSIEDEQGNAPCFDGTRNHWPVCSDSGDKKTVEKMEKLQTKQRLKFSHLVKRNSKKVLGRMTIKDNRDVNTYFFY